MAKTIVEVPSSSTNETHSIRLGQDYRIYCTCKAWQFSKPPIKECKHLIQLFQNENKNVLVELQKPSAVKSSKDKCVLRQVII